MSRRMLQQRSEGSREYFDRYRPLEFGRAVMALAAERAMHPLKYIAPVASIAVLALIAALPWGLPSEDRFFLPLLPVIAIHYWSLRYPAMIPEWFVFVTGLGLDILTHGPLGYWALIYLAAHSIAVLSEPFGRSGQVARVALFVPSLLAVAALAWAVSSVYFFEWADWRPFALGAGLAAIGGLLIIPVLHVLAGAPPGRANASLARGV